MARKKSAKTTGRAVKPEASLEKTFIQNPLSRFNNLLDTRNKKIAIVAAAAALIIIALLIIFKGVFIAATVNGEPITRLSVIRELEKQSGRAMLDSLVTKKLILQEAKKRNINVSQNDIDKELVKIEANIKSQGTTLDEALKTQGMTRDQLSNEIKIQLSIQKMVEKDVKVNAKEIDDYMKSSQEQLVEGAENKLTRAQAEEQLKQQKLQEKTQEFLKILQDKAKILNFVSY